MLRILDQNHNTIWRLNIFVQYHIINISDPHKGEDGLGGVDPALYQRDWDLVLQGIEDEDVGTSNLLEMVLGVLEGQIRGGVIFRI